MNDSTLDIEGALAAVRGICRHTPLLSSQSLERACGGGRILLKAENLQRTGSFKLRGALAKLARLDAAPPAGVVTASAGNHGQALAYAARSRGLACEVFMPEDAPLSKVAAVEAFGGRVRLAEGVVEECVVAARARAEDAGMTFVHPFDDLDVIAGQATVGLELLEDAPDLARVIVPVGGGGLISGLAVAVKERRPEVDVIGVQAALCAPFRESLAAGHPVEVAGAAGIADGIAVKRPGELTLGFVERFVDDLCEVGDDDVADAIVTLLERAKLVVEGAGAVGVAALLRGVVKPAASGSTVVVLSGGNIDAGLLATVTRRHETERGRRLRVFTRVADRPGSLARLLAMVADGGANLIDIEHIRDAVPLHVRESGVELTLETRNAEHAEKLLAALAEAGYSTERLS